MRNKLHTKYTVKKGKSKRTLGKNLTKEDLKKLKNKKVMNKELEKITEINREKVLA